MGDESKAVGSGSPTALLFLAAPELKARLRVRRWGAAFFQKFLRSPSRSEYGASGHSGEGPEGYP